MFLAEHVAHWGTRKSDEGWTHSDHEIACRVHLTSAINIGCVEFHFWSTPDLRWGKYDERSAWLGVREDPGAIERWRTRGDEQYKADYYLQGGIPNELAIILTVLTRCHFVYRRSLKSSGLAIMQEFSNVLVARGPFDGKEVKLNEVQPRLEKILAVAAKDRGKASRFMLASRFYHLSLPLLEEDHDLAYLFLTSAIEALLYDYNPRGFGLADANPQLAHFLQEKLDAAAYDEAEKAFLKHAPKVKVRFVQFIEEYLPDAYWTDATRPTREQGQMPRAELGTFLRRIYDARSKFVHEGEPLPPQMRFDYETPHGLAVMAGHKKWEQKEMLPHSRTFERMVHHVLVEYIERHSR